MGLRRTWLYWNRPDAPRQSDFAHAWKLSNSAKVLEGGAFPKPRSGACIDDAEMHDPRRGLGKAFFQELSQS